jgi:hypothetical protein
MNMEAQRAAKEWLATELAWEARLERLRSDYADRHGWDSYPGHRWDERAAA